MMHLAIICSLNRLNGIEPEFLLPFIVKKKKKKDYNNKRTHNECISQGKKWIDMHFMENEFDTRSGFGVITVHRSFCSRQKEWVSFALETFFDITLVIQMS